MSQNRTAEQQRRYYDTRNKKYQERMQNDPIFAEKERERNRNRMLVKYHSDEEFRLTNNAKARAYNKKHKTEITLSKTKKKEILLPWINEIKQNSGCKFCLEKDHRCLDFHHLNPSEKDATIAYMYAADYSIEKIVEEIEKCVVLCSNCHRKLHYEERKIR